MTRLTIVRSGLPLPQSAAGEVVVSFDELHAWIKRGTALAHLARHTDGRLIVHRLETVGRPLWLGLALRGLCRGRIFLEDTRGRRRALTIGKLTRWLGQIALEPFRVPALVGEMERTVSELEARPDHGTTGSTSASTSGSNSRATPSRLNLAASPLYLRTDLSFGVRAGGSVGHIAGVLNELDRFTGPPIFLTTDEVATVKPTIELHQIAPAEAFWNFEDLPTFLLNDLFDETAERVLSGRPLAFVYQRYSLNSYAGLRIARRHRVPLVIEYNGSEIWMSRHWGRRLKYTALSERIERLNLSRADLVVVVSRAMADEVIGRGVDARRVLTNANGVDPVRYSPEIAGDAIRTRYNLDSAIVIGFIGTFGPWHGAEVLARAFVALLKHREGARQRDACETDVRLLLIGDGATMAAVRQILAEGGALGKTTFTGLVAQEEGPEHLAACDILASPHVPNPDGTPFFGSPTKVFEYMAMGKAIAASNLDQVGEVLEHGRTAWLVPPGDADSLARALRLLIDDVDLRSRLGAEARRRVAAEHTWQQHTRRTIQRLSELVQGEGGGCGSAA